MILASFEKATKVDYSDSHPLNYFLYAYDHTAGHNLHYEQYLFRSFLNLAKNTQA